MPPPKYGDFSTGLSYHDAMTRVTDAQHSFEHLPAHIKKHCRQDPGEFLDMVFDPARRAEMIELGMIDAAVPDGGVMPSVDPEDIPPVVVPAEEPKE